jgi:universal stress protein E
MVSTVAFERAAQLARGMGASLRIVAFVHQEVLDAAASDDELPEAPSHRSPLWSFQRWLIAEASRLNQGGLQVCAEVLWNERTAASICHYIDESEVALVIKDMEHELMTDGMTLSNLDWQLLHESPVPVLFIKRHESSAPQRMVASVDILHYESDVRGMNRTCIETAAQLAQSCGGSLHLLSVYDCDALPVADQEEFCVPALLTCGRSESRPIDGFALSAG